MSLDLGHISDELHVLPQETEAGVGTFEFEGVGSPAQGRREKKKEAVEGQ